MKKIPGWISSVTLAAVMVVLTGCIKENGCSRLSDEYFPNRIGNWWVYDRFDSLAMEKTMLRVDIVKDSVQKDGSTYRMWVFSKSNIYDTLFVRTTSDSVLFFRYPEGYPNEVMLLPLAVGSWWTHPFMVRDSTRVISKDTVTVNYEEYPDAFCIRRKLFAFNDYLTDTRWFVPYLGLVRLENWHYLFGWISKENWELKSYSLDSGKSR